MSVLRSKIFHYTARADLQAALVGVAVGVVFLAFSWKIALVVTVGAVVAIYLMGHPHHAMLLTIATIPFEMVGRITGAYSAVPLSLSKLFGAITLCAVIWSVLTAKKKIILTKPFLLIMAFFILALINYNFAADRDAALTGLQRIGVTLGFYFLIMQTLDTWDRLRQALWAISMALIVSAMAAIAQRFGRSLSYQDAVMTYGRFYGSVVENLDAFDFVRTTGFYADPDIFAFVLLIPVGLILLQLSKTKSARGEKVLLLGALVLVLGGIVSSHSRTGLVGLFVLVVLFFIRLIRFKPVYMVYLLVALAILVPLVPSSYWMRIKSITDIKGSYTSSARITIYKDAIPMYLDNWLIGVGADNFPANFERYTQSDIRPAGTMNLYLQVATEYGTVGLVIFFLLMWDIFRSSRSVKKELLSDGDKENYKLILAIEIIIIAMLTCGLTIHTMERKEFWLLLALPVAARNIFTKRMPKPTGNDIRPDEARNLR